MLRCSVSGKLVAMSTQEIAAKAMALPLAERVSLAQALWESIDAGLPDMPDDVAVADAVRRDQELAAGSATGRSHDEVMKAARRVIGCG